MSMQILTILQFFSAFGAYFFLTMLLPALIFHRKFREERIVVRFFFYLIIGNFFFINLVFLLQLLHISNRFTLIACTVIAAGYGMFRVNGLSPKENMAETRRMLYKVMSGTMGYRLIWERIRNRGKKKLGNLWNRISLSMRKYFMDWVLTAVVTVLLLWMYGISMIENMGYHASDMPVHNYWINAMGDGLNNVESNRIFVAGVYPFGFHCMMYFMHTVFGMETYVLLRVFCLVQTLFIHYVLLAFLRGCCRTRYVAYGAMGIFVLASFWGVNTYIRYYSTLPQEFGMIFILPSIYFLYMFFEVRKKEVQGILEKKSMRYLFGFAMSFSLTLSVHFYDTMVAGILCLGIAAGYGFRLFRKAYFGRVLLTGIISVFIAVLPMGIAFATGTPLEGSLKWGMSIIEGSGDEEEDMENTATDALEKEDTEEESSGQQTEATPTDSSYPGGEGDSGSFGETQHTYSQELQKKSLGEKIHELVQILQDKGMYLEKSIRESLKAAVIVDAGDNLYRFLFICLAITGGFGILCLFGNDKDYGARLLSSCFGIFFLLCMLSARKIGIPELLDQNRCSIYTAYLLPVVFASANDALICALLGKRKSAKPMDVVSLLTAALWMVMLLSAGKVRVPADVDALETNGAITCLTNILKENQEGTFTICSANDELRMVEDYGYFYETINFLRDMEGEKVEKNLTIPTKYVYFFIEKVPIDYLVSYDGSGLRISEEGAAHRLPGGTGLGVYQSKNRWIVMSRMYYWAEAFRNLYKNEMRVYYESDDFICYEVEQNTYRLFDFSIDYGYNTMFE